MNSKIVPALQRHRACKSNYYSINNYLLLSCFEQQVGFNTTKVYAMVMMVMMVMMVIKDVVWNQILCLSPPFHFPSFSSSGEMNYYSCCFHFCYSLAISKKKRQIAERTAFCFWDEVQSALSGKQHYYHYDRKYFIMVHLMLE